MVRKSIDILLEIVDSHKIQNCDWVQLVLICETSTTNGEDIGRLTYILWKIPYGEFVENVHSNFVEIGKYSSYNGKKG